MTLAPLGPSQDEERLIREAQENFAGFFRWIGILNEMIQKEIGPKFGLVVNNPEVNVAERKVSGTLDASRPGKAGLSIPFAIIGDRISFDYEKFALTDKATGEKSSEFTTKATDDVNRILADIVQDYIG
jgi:hypothetical protein